MRGEMDNKDKNYLSLPHRECCDLMYKVEDKNNRKISTAHTKRLANQKFVIDYDSDAIPRVTHNKKARTGALLARK